MAALTSDEVQEQQHSPSNTTKSSTRRLPADSSGADKNTESESSSIEPSLDITKPRRREKSTQDAAEATTADKENISKKKSRKKRLQHTKPTEVSPEKAKKTANSIDMKSPFSEPGFLFDKPQTQRNSKPPSTEGKGNSGALSLRLDLNLEIEIQLKAKIHGDLTLTLL